MSSGSDAQVPLARRLASSGRSAVQAVRDGASQLVAWQLKLPPGASRMRQLVHGLWLPMVVARAVLADRRVRRRWLRYSVGQVVATLAVGAVMLGYTSGRQPSRLDAEVLEAGRSAVGDIRERVQDRAEQLRAIAPEAEAELIREEQQLIDDRVELAGERMEGDGERESRPRRGAGVRVHDIAGIPPGELSTQMALALDDAALERAAKEQERLRRAVKRLDGEKLGAEVKRQVRQRLGGAGITVEESGKPPASPRAPELPSKPPVPEPLGAPRAPEPSGGLPVPEPLGAPRAPEPSGESHVPEPPGSPRAPEPPRPPGSLEPEVVDGVAELLEAASDPVAPPPPRTPREVARARQVRAELKRAALAELPAAEAKIEAARPWLSRLGVSGTPWRVIGWLVAFWGALYIAQYVVIALCRDFHAELAREACLLTGIAPEDPPCQPRPRFDWAWVKKRVRRILRGWRVIAVGLPLCWLIGGPFPGDVVQSALVLAWIGYWQVVFAASKSARAWVDEFVAPAPWFMRGWNWLVAKVPGFGLLGWYGRLWDRSSRGLYAPAECVEQLPAPFTGLMIFRLVGSLPLLKIFVRPLVPVASALLLEAHRERHPARTAPVILAATPVLGSSQGPAQAPAAP